MRISLITAVCLLFTVFAHAQAPGGGSPGSGGPAPAPVVPIDGGASILLASGVAYGLRRLKQRRS